MKRFLYLTLISAKDLKKVSCSSKPMEVYAVVSLHGDFHNGKQKSKTLVVPNCGTDTITFPYSAMRFELDDYLLTPQHVQPPVTLKIKLVCRRTLVNKVIGSVHVPLKELFDSGNPGHMNLTSSQVCRPSGTPKGELSFYYMFGDKYTVPAKKVDSPSYVSQKPEKARTGISTGLKVALLGGMVAALRSKVAVVVCFASISMLAWHSNSRIPETF